MSNGPTIDPFVNIVPMVYAYTTPEIARHNGWTKIGYTEKQTVEDRIKQQSHTVDTVTHLEWKQEARFTDGSGKYFTDHDFHDYLERFHNIQREPKTEWFKIDGRESKKLFREFAGNDYDGVQEADKHSKYYLRAEQALAVQMAYDYYKSNTNPLRSEYLWNCKPRFGKTLTAYDFMRKMGAMNVLIVTNRPSIANSWYDDFERFIGWQTKYTFVSECDALSNRPVLSRKEFIDKMVAGDENDDYPMVAFESLQGLKGSVYFGGNYDKLKWILTTNWDLLIIDEAHEGVDTYKTDKAFDNIKRKFTLHLSGTPFKAIASRKFSKDQIYHWSFTDEQEAKERWSSEAYNPYGVMPRMNLFTYQMSKVIQDKVNQGLDLSEGENVEYAFDLNEFFSTENGNFKYKKDVKKFLDALCNQTRFPFSTPELRAELAHTFWVLERVDSAKALAKMLKEHPVFENYEIIVAAGDGKIDEVGIDNSQSQKSYDRVMDAIKNHDKTITLSVGQLTTGVTVPQWTAVFMLSNMKSPAEYIQAAFRAQNPYKFEKNGKYYQKQNSYIFDFAPERTLLVFDEFANSLYSNTAKGGGTKQEREDNVKRLLNFFSVFAEDEDGEMVALDAAKVMTVPIAIKTEEVIRRGFMSNFLFANIGNVFAAPAVVREILENIPPEEEQGRKKDAPNMNNMEDIPVNEDGEIEVPNEVIVNKTEAIFGQKIYEEEVPDTSKIYQEAEEQIISDGLFGSKDDSTPEQKLAETMAQHVAEKLNTGLYDKAKEEYGLSKKETERIKNKVNQAVKTELSHMADDFSNKKRILDVELKNDIEKAESPAEVSKAQIDYENKLKEATETFVEEMQKKTQEIIGQSAESVVEELETKKEENNKKSVEGDIRAHLRGFARTIPAFIMAYGDYSLKLSNFETYPRDSVFEEVSKITEAQFRFLRDGGDYTDKETGETKHFEGHLFDEVVFDESIKEFLNKKTALANYFDEQSKEDIFDYIPPQETNQIFTPKKVVQMMVDQLEQENPHIFDFPDKTFVDFYMKSGLYITEIVKRLYRNPVIKSLYPDDHDRVKHILECQVFGFAPTNIIFDITMSYIFGFDEKANSISRRNFRNIDTLPYAEAGTLQELVNKEFGDRA